MFHAAALIDQEMYNSLDFRRLDLFAGCNVSQTISCAIIRGAFISVM